MLNRENAGIDFCRAFECSNVPFLAESESKAYFKTDKIDRWIGTLSRATNDSSAMHVVLGGKGAGKTALFRALQSHFSAYRKTTTAIFSDLIDLKKLAACHQEVPTSTSHDLSDPDSLLFDEIRLELQDWANGKVRMLLLIDEGHALPDQVLSIITTFFQARIRTGQILHIVIFGEKKLWEKLTSMERIESSNYQNISLTPLTFVEMRGLIGQQLQTAGCGRPIDALFSRKALHFIHGICGGNPGRVIEFCHLIMLTLFIRNRARAGWAVVCDCAWMLYRKRLLVLEGGRICGWLGSIALFALVMGAFQNHNLPPAPPHEFIVEKTKEHVPVPVAVAATTPLEERVLFPEKENPPATNVAEQPETPQPFSSAVETLASLQMNIASRTEEIKDVSGMQNSGVAFAVEMQQPGEESSAPASALPLPEAQHPSPARGETPIDPDTRLSPSEMKPGREENPREPPSILGEILATDHETLGDMVRGIYGPYSFKPSNTKKVIAVSPDIKDPHRLIIGALVRFPAIPVSIPSDGERLWWIKLISADTLQDAYRYLRIYKDKAPPLLIIPGWSPLGELRFHILLEKYFSQQSAAENSLASLSAKLFPDKTIMNGLDQHNYYYKIKESK